MIYLMTGAKSTKRPLLPKHSKRASSTCQRPMKQIGTLWYVLVFAVGFFIFGDIEVKYRLEKNNRVEVPRWSDYPKGVSRAHDVGLMCKWLACFLHALERDKAILLQNP